ncbi:MAG: site-specific integrase [Thermoproteota archaeon]
MADESVARVVRIRDYSESMTESLGKAVGDFCVFLKVDSPSGAVKKIKKMSGDELVGIFREYFVMRKSSLAPKTLWNWSNAVRIWLLENGINIDAVSRAITREYRRYISPRGIPKLLKRDIIEKEDIRRLLLASDIRTRALIAVLASSGLRVGVSGLRLQLKHFRDDLEKEQECYMLEIPEELTKAERGLEIPHITFISREARDFLLAYLNYRRTRGENITRDSYLFVTSQANGENDYEPRNPTPLTYNGALHLWNKACKRAGIDRKPVNLPGGAKGRQPIRYNIRFHSLRKYFKTACSVAGVDRIATEAMMGHSLSQFGIESVYDYCITNLDWLRQQYLKALPSLTFLLELPSKVIVNGEARKKIEELENEITVLRGEIEYFKTIVTALISGNMYRGKPLSFLLMKLRKYSRTLTPQDLPDFIQVLLALSMRHEELRPQEIDTLNSLLADTAMTLNHLAEKHNIRDPQAEELLKKLLMQYRRT